MYDLCYADSGMFCYTFVTAAINRAQGSLRSCCLQDDCENTLKPIIHVKTDLHLPNIDVLTELCGL